MLAFLQENQAELLEKTWEHISISLLSLLAAIIVAVPLGIVLTKSDKLAKIVLSITSVLQTVPSLAILAMMIPFFGIGTVPAVIALFLYVLLPILNNTYLGIQSVNKDAREAGRAMGMTQNQLLRMVELPLAVPVIMSGIRLSAVYAISWATLASYIGAGGLGDFIFNGLNLYQPKLIIVGAVVVTLLALVTDFVLAYIEKITTPRGLVVSKGEK
ncbi:ABC transporter permease [Macrococcoides caseolyticum]|uniref:Glycine betaine/carnitine/choline ABC transporter, permease protein n=1 Tax=Macrococcus caseolyticus (strain JCSC5402) TaxID=458233 RepID=B9E7K1_MACCJ|nr:ABC transporter permease [Macrococcus caseolyticus]MDJ1152724.1 ABC transporter permease [Macrococcus caseolyticus]MDJ1156289.1 ABC transporter permease [Macrococcus caseolyticus]MEB8171354.1 ABC transporter permease [Macrococcus caseolyticus]BAH18169.1 glycine betaine/carnitine/choline ABC transporter, permease protein [Macrococcus caseolyticus JCSC5402]